jgi:2-C-methyl-D-erythritol 4-phosphate cytidylyltransferase
MITCIILAGGKGLRTQLDTPKQFILAKDKPVFTYSAITLNNCPDIDSIVLVCPEEWIEYAQSWINDLGLEKVKYFAISGKSRQHSILSGLCKAATFMRSKDTIMIHDAARPIIKIEVLNNLIATAKEYGSALPVIQINDAVYTGINENIIIGIVDKAYKYHGQSPVCLNFGEYLYVNQNASDEEISAAKGTCTLLLNKNYHIHTVIGDRSTFKITTQDDLQGFIELLNEKPFIGY